MLVHSQSLVPVLVLDESRQIGGDKVVVYGVDFVHSATPNNEHTCFVLITLSFNNSANLVADEGNEPWGVSHVRVRALAGVLGAFVSVEPGRDDDFEDSREYGV